MDRYNVLRECAAALQSAHEQLEIEYQQGRSTINAEGWKVICDINLQALINAQALLTEMENDRAADEISDRL